MSTPKANRPTTQRRPCEVSVVEYDAHGRPTRRTRFFLDRSELPWLPVSEPAFLLWVFAGLFVVWLAIGLFLLA
jgi:hypothetical protein